MMNVPVKRAITRRPEVTGSLLTGGPKMPQMAHFHHFEIRYLKIWRLWAQTGIGFGFSVPKLVKNNNENPLNHIVVNQCNHPKSIYSSVKWGKHMIAL